MISVILNGFEPDRRNGSVEDSVLRVSSTSSSTSGAKSSSIGSEGASVSMDVRVSDSGIDVNCAVHNSEKARVLNADSKGYIEGNEVIGSDEASVSMEHDVVHHSDKVRVLNAEGNEVIVSQVKKEEGNSSVGDAGVGDSDAETNRSDMVNLEGKDKVALIPVKTDARHGKVTGKNHKVEYKMVSKLDEYAANWKRWTVGYGFEMGDMVWGKVKSHPWWPGHILSEAFASPAVRRSKSEGFILVAFYGDCSYGWFDPAELIPFEPTFYEKSQQTNVKNFVKSVEEAVDEVSRRSNLGLVCHCSKKNNLRAESVEGFFAVDFSDLEQNYTYSASQIKKARDTFQPKETLAFMKKLAVKPKCKGHGKLNFIKKKATVLSYRKAVFEEYDPTYAEAFGTHLIPSSQQAKGIAQQFRDPSRAPLSGRLVLAETLGKGKSSTKSNKMKDRVEKDRYLFKRRDEPGHLKTRKVVEAQGSPGNLIHLDGSALTGKNQCPSAIDNVPCASGSTLIEGLKKTSSEEAPVEEFHGRGQAEKSVSDVHPSLPVEARIRLEGAKLHLNSIGEKVKVRKRPAGEVSGGTSPSLVKKKKKKDLGLKMDSNPAEVRAAAASDPVVLDKVSRESLQVPSASREDLQIDSQQKDDAANSSMLLDPAVTEQNVGIRSNEFDLPQVLSDLHALALNPFYSADSKNLKTIQEVFLRFRSLAYQKSLALSAAAENESYPPVSKSLAVSPASDTVPTDQLRQSSSIKPQKPPARADDPTKGGRKRGPSDRQEEISTKKKKKMNDLKVLVAEKKASLKAPEVQQGDGKEMPAKIQASIPGRISKSGIGKKKELAEKLPEPTMLVMKFPSNGALPSISELKAKFARFGPLDHSATRVFWKSSTCRLVYKYRHYAVAAYKFAVGSSNLFGNSDVKCFLREVGAEAQEMDPTPKDVTAQPQQLKSCLKKTSGDEGVAPNGGNGSNRGTRVKFVLGGEEDSRSEQMIDSKKVNNTSSIADRSASSSSTTNINNNFTKVIPQTQSSSSLSMVPLPTAQFDKEPNNVVQFTEASSQRNVSNFNNTMSIHEVDISQQMLSLLIKCNEVVNNLSGSLGYVPYHPL